MRLRAPSNQGNMEAPPSFEIGEMVADFSQPLRRREGVALLCLSFLCCWHAGLQASFVADTWWSFLNPVTLGFSFFGALSLAAPLFLLPLLLEVRPVMAFLVKRFWLPAGVLPMVLLCATVLAGGASHRLRTTAMAPAVVCGPIVFVVCCLESTMLARLLPFALALGLLLLQAVKLGFASLNPAADVAPGTHFLCLKIGAAWMALTCSLVLRRVSPPPVVAVAPRARGPACWAVAPVLAGGLTLHSALLMNPSMLAKYTGHDLFPAGVSVPFLVALGIPLAAALQLKPVAATGTAAAGLIFGVALLAGTTACRNVSTCGGWNSFAGAVFMATTMPVFWVAACAQAAQLIRAGLAGRLLALSGFFVYVHVQLYICVVTGIPFDLIGLGAIWLWLVAVPAALGLLAGVLPLRACAPGETPVSGRALTASVALVVAVALLPATVYRWSEVRNVAKAEGDAVFTAMSYNVQGGFTTTGLWNGACIADILKKHQPDHVAFPESEGMRFQTGNRDHMDWVSAHWSAYVYFGAPAWVGGAGVATASPWVPSEQQWMVMPRAVGKMNRLLLKTVYDFQGTALTVFSTHTEWFGDPGEQTRFIAEKAQAAARQGPVLLMGDFNLEPNGANNNAPNASSLSVITRGDVLQSATSLECLQGRTPLGHLCASPIETVNTDTMCNPCKDYQLDYIFYSPRWLELAPDPGSAHTVDSRLLEGGWCADHEPLLASFKLKPGALEIRS